MKKTLSLRHDFSESEINEISRQLVDNLNHKQETVNNKSMEMKKFNNELKFWETKINETSTLIDDGFEYRDIDCDVTYNTPNEGVKSIERLDTGEKWTEPMTIDEFDLFNINNVNTEEE